MEKQRTLVYNLRYNQPPEVIWPTVSETQRLNLAAGTGFAPYAAEEVLQSDGSVVRQAHKKMGLFTWRWKEGFGEWVEGRFCNHVRRFENGPFQELSLNVILEPDRGGTVIHMEFLARWRSVLGDVLAAIGALSKITRPVVDTLDQLAQDHLAELETGNAPPLPPIAKETKAAAIQQRLGQAVERLKAGPYGFGLADQLRSYLLAEDAVTLKRLRPLALAKQWQVPQKMPSPCSSPPTRRACFRCAGKFSVRAAGAARQRRNPSPTCRQRCIARPAISTMAAISPTMWSWFSVPLRG